MSAFLSPTRPHTVTLTLWGVFLLGAWNAGRAILLGLLDDMWLQLAIEPNLSLRSAIALVWAVLFWTMGFLLRGRRPVTRKALPSLLLVYALTELGLLFFFAQAPNARRALTLDALFYGVIILFSTWSLNRSAAGIFFDEK